MTFRIAVVQPISHRPGDDERNVADAVRTIERAAGEGAHFVCFPWVARPPSHYSRGSPQSEGQATKNARSLPTNC